MKKTFNDSQWRQKMYENRMMLSEANGASSVRSLKNVRDLYEDLMMGLEMSMEDAGETGLAKSNWNRIDDVIQKNFNDLERWIKRNKKILK